MKSKRLCPKKRKAAKGRKYRKRLAATLALAFFAYSCSSTHMLDRNSGFTYRKLNATFSGKTVYARFANGSLQKIDYIRATPDSIVFVYAHTGVRNTLPISEIHSIYLKNWKRGLKHGLIIGGLIGIPLGILAAESVKTEEMEVHPVVDPVLNYAIKRTTTQEKISGFFGVVTVGFIIGGLIGTSAGSPDIYQLATPEEMQHKKK